MSNLQTALDNNRRWTCKLHVGTVADYSEKNSCLQTVRHRSRGTTDKLVSANGSIRKNKGA